MAGSGIQNSVSGSRRINSKASASVIPGRVEFCPRIAEKRRALCEEEKIRYGTRGATTLKRDSLHSPLKPRLAIVPPQWQTRENGFNFRVPEPSRAVVVYSFVVSPPSPGVLPLRREQPPPFRYSSAVALTLFNFDRAPLHCA